MIDYLIIFTAQFFSVFALVMGSKLLRDDRWILAMLNSWLISITQFMFVYLVAKSSNDIYVMFFWSAMGGSLGCGISHLVYTRYIFKE